MDFLFRCSHLEIALIAYSVKGEAKNHLTGLILVEEMRNNSKV
jgi:hypothetical protein